MELEGGKQKSDLVRRRFIADLFDQNFHNDLKFTTDGQQNQTSHEPRSRAFYFIINSLLHTWNSYYTEPPVKVPITPHHLEYSYYGPPPIVIALGSFSHGKIGSHRKINGHLSSSNLISQFRSLLGFFCSFSCFPAVPFNSCQVFPGYLTTAHHLYAFSTVWGQGGLAV